MPVRVRVEPIAKDIAVIVRDDLSPAAQSKAIADFARQQLAEAQDQNRRVLGRVPPHSTAVDGRQNASLESVRPNGGTIVFEFELIADLLIWIGQTLQDRSPVISGDYKRGHTLFADGVEVPLGETVPAAEEYVFLNLVPYARKIEIGKTKSGRDFVIQVPNRIYERTAADAKRRFGNQAKIRFSYRAPIASRIASYVPIGRGRTRPRATAAQRAAANTERAARVPAIVVTVR